MSTFLALIRENPLPSALALFTLFAAYVLRGRKDGGPPRVPYWVPWIGSAVTLGKDPDAFFATAKQEYGSIFRVKAAGKEMTYVTSSELIQAIYRDANTFQFTVIRQEMQVQVFKLPHDISYSEELSESFFPAHHRALVPGNIRGLLASYAHHTHQELRTRFNNVTESSGGVPLAFIIAPAAYCAAGKALYGASYPADQTMERFNKFDTVFHMIAGGLPLWLIPSARKGWEDLNVANEGHLRTLRQTKEKLTDFMEMLLGEGEKHQWSDQTVANILAISVWAVEANTTWAIYWSIVFLLQYPNVMDSVLAEVDAARAKWLGAHTDTQLSQANFHDFMQDSSDQFPLLTSCIQESLRLRSSSFSIRRVANPTEFAGYHFDAGEHLVCNTRALHMDEKIYERPTEFVYDRFTEAGKKRAVQNGRSASPPFLPFGGGVSMCEGRHFAMGAMKTFIAILLTFYTIKVDPNSSGEFPQPNMERIGVGLIGPKGDVDVLIRRRSL